MHIQITKSTPVNTSLPLYLSSLVRTCMDGPQIYLEVVVVPHKSDRTLELGSGPWGMCELRLGTRGRVGGFFLQGPRVYFQGVAGLGIYWNTMSVV